MYGYVIIGNRAGLNINEQRENNENNQNNNENTNLNSNSIQNNNNNNGIVTFTRLGLSHIRSIINFRINNNVIVEMERPQDNNNENRDQQIEIIENQEINETPIDPGPF